MRVGTLVIGMLLVATALAPAAHAAAGRAVTGPVVGSAPFDFTGCSYVHQAFEGDISTPSGQVATIDVDLCLGLPKRDSCTVKGSFVIDEGGRKVKGGASGSLHCALQKRMPFDFTLHVRRAAPGLADVGQDLHFRGAWRWDQMSGGPIKGRVSLT